MTERPEACPRCGYVLVQPPPPPPTYLPPVAPYPASPPGPPARSGLSAASVPRILLGLGATCLLVAAVIFLAVAFSAVLTFVGVKLIDRLRRKDAETEARDIIARAIMAIAAGEILKGPSGPLRFCKIVDCPRACSAGLEQFQN